ncbi:hypothetical protein SEUCBS139899_007651 [Sporothrix eucalyptigena]
MVFRTLHDLDSTAGTVRLVEGGLSPAFYDMSIEFDKSVAEMSGLLTYCVLALGLGNFLWVPCAEYFGKRPVFVVSSAIFFAFLCWSATAKSFETLLTSRVILSIAGGSTEALGAAIVNDLFYLHERGAKMGMYMVGLTLGNSVGPLIGGFVAETIGWRWFLWLSTILSGITFAAVVLFVPETRFKRKYDDGIIPTNGREVESKSPALEIEQTSADGNSLVPARKTYWQQLSLWSGIPEDVSFFAILLQPFPLLFYPAVFWAVLGYAMSLVIVIAINSLYSFVYQAPPYNFNAGISGLINAAGIVGNLFGAFVSGYLLDRFCEWMARRNNGIFVPESRLPLLVIPGVLVPVGTLMFGFAAQKQMNWAVGYVGYGLVAVGLAATANIAMVYVMDSYYPVAAEALLLINGFKNVVAFGFTYGVVPWVESSGYATAFGTLAGVYIFIMCLAIPLYYYGAHIRNHTSSKWKLVTL